MFDKDPNCAPIEEAIKALRDNAELIDWYRKVQRLSAGPVISLLPAKELPGDTVECKCLKNLTLKPGEERFAASAEFLTPMIDLIPIGLIKSMHAKNRLINLLTMKLELVHNRIPDTAIAKYVQANTKELLDPFTSAPIEWNPVRRELFYENPRKQGTMSIRF